MVRYCAALTCNVNDAKSDLRFFRAPDKRKNLQLHKIWSTFAGDELGKSSFLCSLHFKDADYLGQSKAKLRKEAYPTWNNTLIAKPPTPTHTVNVTLNEGVSTCLVQVTSTILLCINIGITNANTKSVSIFSAKPVSSKQTKREKDAAMERLKSDTLSVQGSVKAVELVRSVLKELSPKALALMPSEESLVRNVRRWAKRSNIPLVKTFTDDHGTSDEPSTSFSGQDISNEARDPSMTLDSSEWGDDNTHSNEVVKTDIIYTEPVAEITGYEDKKPSGLIYLKGRHHGKDVGNSSNPIQKMKSAPSTSVDFNDDAHDFCEDGDDFQMEIESEPEGVSSPLPYFSKAKPSHVVNTSSNLKVHKSHKKRKDAVKSGERCFVCGDELIVAETLASSEETFRKACSYLNVKSEGTWFPRTKNSKFYSFCESCTDEIMRIHSLYRKVEEIQSLIFRKVESVEKRIADAEIVDNWMAEAPHSTTVRFEGFRKQVMINYRNKLKLRRAIRIEKKTGNPLMEIQPCSSAHMFAKNPSETNAFCRIIPDSITSKHNSTETTPFEQPAPPLRRTRGKPKSKKSPEEDETIPAPEPNPDLPAFGDSPIADRNDDADFFNECADSNDAMSVTSEKEVKFWEDDPKKLELGRRSSRRRTTRKNTDPPEDEDAEWDDANDPDYEEKEDEEWETKQTKIKRTAKTHPSSKMSRWPSRELKKPAGPRQIIVEENSRKRKKIQHSKPHSSRKAVKPSSSYNIQFPEAVLGKDGRVFMEGIEIIKNPPGFSKPHPYSVTYTCGSCETTTVGFWRIQNHICGVHLGLFKCHICNKQFSEAKVISRHITAVHGEGNFEDCPVCGKPVKVYRKSMQRHRWLHLSEEEKKDSRYKSWCPPDRRAGRQTPRKSFMCGQCGKTFGLIATLRKHELTHIPGNELSFICQYCGKVFNKRKGLTQHVLRCSRKAQGISNLTTYPCPKCPTRFSARATRSKHIRRFHNKLTSADLLFSCPKCPRKFNTRNGFKTHKRVCIDGLKGHNNKSTVDRLHYTSSAANVNHGENPEIKFDSTTTASSSSAMYNNLITSSSRNTQDSTAMDAATVLGFNYNLMGDGSSYSESL